MRAEKFGRGLHTAVLVCCSLAFAALLCARLLGVLPNAWFTPLTLGAAPLLAFAVALATTRHPDKADVARAVDERANTKELFLSVTTITETSGEYRDVVIAQAEERAAQLEAARLFPLNWMPGARNATLATAALAAGVLWMPQFDPFKVDEKRQEQAKQEARLAETKKITAIRKDELKEKGGALTEQVDVALAKLDKTFKEAKPQERELNAQKLNEQAQDFSELWKKASAQVPKAALDKAAQQFGDSQQRQAMKGMLDKLKKGDAKGLKQAMEKLGKQMQEIAKQPDGAGKKEQLDKLAKELGQMANQLREQLGDKALNEALARAAEQLGMANGRGISKDALDAASESLGLGKEELQRLAETFKDVQNIEDALKELAAARQLNELGKLDGRDAGDAGAGSAADLRKLQDKLKQLLAAGNDGGNQQNGGAAGGTDGGGPGPLKKGTETEDDTAKLGSKPARSPSLIGPGKFLMEWKDDGVGETGAKAGAYNDAVKAVREAAAEAIRNERVPPGYHGVIQKYFDNLPAKPH